MLHLLNGMLRHILPLSKKLQLPQVGYYTWPYCDFDNLSNISNCSALTDFIVHNSYIPSVSLLLHASSHTIAELPNTGKKKEKKN